MTFTVIFKNRLRDVPGNPFTAETPFGPVRAAGIGNAYAERDVLEEALQAIAAGGISDVEEYAQDAIERAAKLAED